MSEIKDNFIMKITIFIDGQHGTTRLKIHERLKAIYSSAPSTPLPLRTAFVAIRRASPTARSNPSARHNP
jgi:hypothetical protein